MNRRLVAATGNAGKLREFREILHPGGFTVVSAAEAGWTGDVVEDGDTLEANAVKKAREVARGTGLPALADDTGLFVDALGGAPGVRSARYAGPGQDPAANCDRLLRELSGVPAERRGAAFRCVIALAGPDGEVLTFEGEVRGRIAGEKRGTSGFGYDPLFEIEDLGLTFAELDAEAKHRISHRGRALARLRAHLGESTEKNAR